MNAYISIFQFGYLYNAYEFHSRMWAMEWGEFPSQRLYVCLCWGDGEIRYKIYLNLILKDQKFIRDLIEFMLSVGG